MDVHPWAWGVTLGLIAIMLTVDFVGHVRKPHAPSLKEAGLWSAGYVAIALLFGVYVWLVWGGDFGNQYFAGYITEKSLSVDNLFVFVLIMASFRVPREYQQKVLLIGIVIALALRTVFIFLGAAIVNEFAWVFYIFGAFLLYTAYTQIKGSNDDDEEFKENAMVRLTRRVFPTTEGFVGDKMFVVQDGRRHITPMLIVMLAIGSADILFAVDSIPAIFGLTQETYLIFAANAFSLLGLRQLFFLIDGLLDRLVYLNYGLAAILAFIGAKLVIHAMHENEVPFINGGEPIHAIPEISTNISLVVIVGILAITTISSLTIGKRRAAAAESEESERELEPR
ncbi:TerC family protein [Occultella glacieicola]|uniref:TerC family protein n=1 Tax=Occultella glacieicola TaxID=2518684 RepID=A0ABY2DZW2_9MICO|nr:TerC family protein [Occultella glacieicola]TDE90420.1 TerC family protein [Occultella glacieicola]